MRFVFIETRSYAVEADTIEEAQEIYDDHGPEISIEEPVEDLGLCGSRMFREGRASFPADRSSPTGMRKDSQ